MKQSMHHRRMSQGFTLIELLGVIVIIAILASMTLAGMQAVWRSQRKNNARSDAQALAKYILSYRNNYGKWPGQIGATEPTYTDGTAPDQNQADIIAALESNPRDLDEIWEETSFQIENGRCVDPWGRPYVVAMDVNGNGITTVSTDLYNPAPAMVLNPTVRVAVISWGADPNDSSGYLTSWQN